MATIFTLFADAVAKSAPPPPPETFWHFYATNLRASLFSGFLTLTGFLFAVKTFIVVSMKRELYDTDEYRSRVAARREFNKKVTVYGPLQRLSGLLFWSVIASLVTAASQLTVGLVPEWWAAGLCMLLALVTVLLLLCDLIVIRCNLNQWFKFLEDAAKPKPAPVIAAPPVDASTPSEGGLPRS